MQRSPFIWPPCSANWLSILEKSTHPNPIKQNVHITHDLSQLRKKQIKKTKELEGTRVQYLMATNAVPKYAGMPLIGQL